jgi:hypothetical protein
MEEPKGRPDVLPGNTVKVETAQCENCYVTLNKLGDKEYEIWLRHGKMGGCEQAHKHAIGVLMSVALQAGVSPEEIARKLMSIGCPHPNPWGKKPNKSCIDGIAKAVLKAMGRDENVKERVQHDPGPADPHT